MTSDHGNTAAIAKGRFAKPSVLAEPASRHAVIYAASFDAGGLGKFDATRYSGGIFAGWIWRISVQHGYLLR